MKKILFGTANKEKFVMLDIFYHRFQLKFWTLTNWDSN